MQYARHVISTYSIAAINLPYIGQEFVLLRPNISYETVKVLLLNLALNPTLCTLIRTVFHTKTNRYHQRTAEFLSINLLPCGASSWTSVQVFMSLLLPVVWKTESSISVPRLLPFFVEPKKVNLFVMCVWESSLRTHNAEVQLTVF